MKRVLETLFSALADDLHLLCACRFRGNSSVSARPCGWRVPGAADRSRNCSGSRLISMKDGVGRSRSRTGSAPRSAAWKRVADITPVSGKLARFRRAHLDHVGISVHVLVFLLLLLIPAPDVGGLSARYVVSALAGAAQCVAAGGRATTLAGVRTDDAAACSLVSCMDDWRVHGVSPVLLAIFHRAAWHVTMAAIYLFITPGIRYSVWPKSIIFQFPPQVSPTDPATSP
jgi:hypothetical protein